MRVLYNMACILQSSLHHLFFFCNKESTGSLYILADGSPGDWLAGILYSAGQQANVAVQDQLSALSFTRFLSSVKYSDFDCFVYAPASSSSITGFIDVYFAVWLSFLGLGL